MARKPKAKGPAEGRERGKRTTGRPPTKDVGRTYADLLQGWTDFYRDMGSRLSDGLAKQQRAYGELFDTWNGFANTAGKVVNDMATDPSQREVVDAWRNYVNKMGSRIARATTDGLKGYGDVAASVQAYAGKVTDATGSVAGGRLDAAKTEEAYDAWLGVVATLRRQIEQAVGLTREELEDLSRTWLEFSSKMESLAAKQPGKEGPSAEFVELWTKQSKAVGEAIAALVRGQDHDYEETRKAWTDHFTKVQGTMAELASAIGASYEEMYRRFLRGGSTPLSDLPMLTWWWPREKETKPEG